jgi:polyhydroxyalkanoate synthesis regulator phasin
MTRENWADEFVDFMQSTLENTMQTIFTLQDQGEKMINTLIDQGIVAHQEGRKVVNEWLSMARKSREDYARMMRENMDKIEDFLVAGLASEKGKEK